ncbi:MAG: NAD-dependent deacetylase [Algoriphagus sp.]|jgi:NAD-dependent deacetylase
MKKKLVVLTGAGISAESGLRTFRDSDGLWENHRVEDVATPEAFAANPKLVLDFYNERRKFASEAIPNLAHKTLAKLEAYFDVSIITQNVDDLHERGGSSHVLHLHGQLSQARSILNPNKVFNIGNKAINFGDLAEDGGQLRPHIVWFGEEVLMIIEAAKICEEADLFAIIGTSLQVYPASGLINYVPRNAQKYLIDRYLPEVVDINLNMTFLEGPATEMVPLLMKKLTEEVQN